MINRPDIVKEEHLLFFGRAKNVNITNIFKPSQE